MSGYGLLLLIVVISCYATKARSDASNHRYKSGDLVPFYVNKIGPYSNPSETYAYSDLPYCSSDRVEDRGFSLREALNGDRLVSSPYRLRFLINETSKVVCRKNLTKQQTSLFRNAIANDYYYQMYLDDLPMWGFIGQYDSYSTEDPRYLLTNRIKLTVHYNKDRVVEVALLTIHEFADITADAGVEVEFSYSVTWEETNVPFEKRMEYFRSSALLPHHMTIHHSVVTGSFVVVFVLVGCLIMFYVLVLRKDISKYADDDEGNESADANQEETGWKYLHADVFRYPKHKALFAAFLGAGTQLLTITLFVIILGVFGVFYPYNHGLFASANLFMYAITSVVSGYTAVSFYSQLQGTNWARNLIVTGGIVFGPILVTFSFLNVVASAYGATAALSTRWMFVIFVIWAFLALPLILLGGLFGKNCSKLELQVPCRTSNIPREIPQLRWYKGLIPQMVLAGILPIGVLYIELYFIFASVWGFRIYTLYGVLLFVYIAVLVVTSLVSVSVTYFQLAAEDHRWWWRSFLCGGSTGLYIYGYCIYYYVTRTNMSGFLQLPFYFGYMSCICYGAFLMLGTVGFYASLYFVRYLYGSIKCE